MKLKKYKLKKSIKIVLLIIFISTFLFSTYKIIIYLIDAKKLNEVVKEITIETPAIERQPTENSQNINPPEEKEEELSDYWKFIETPYVDVDFDGLIKQNKDTVAWIQVNNTNVNYPVVQSSNNDYYLTHAFDKSYNKSGWLFMDYRNDSNSFDTNTIIYGHSMRNTTMFGTLLKAKKSSWYKNKENWVIKLSTKNAYTLWQIFSLYVIKKENYYITTEFGTDEQINEFFQTLTDRSIYNFNSPPITSDKVLTLSTCASSNGDDRFVIHAKLIKIEQKN